MEEFKNETPFSEKEIAIVNNYNIKTGAIPFVLSFMAVCLLAGLVFLFIDIASAVLIFSALVLVFVPLIIFVFYRLKKNEKLTSKDIKSDMSNHYTFYESHFLVESVEKGQIVGALSYGYKEIYKVTVLYEYVLIFVDRKNCYVLAKECMTKGKALDLIMFLYNKKIKIHNLRKGAKQRYLNK